MSQFDPYEKTKDMLSAIPHYFSVLDEKINEVRKDNKDLESKVKDIEDKVFPRQGLIRFNINNISIIIGIFLASMGFLYSGFDLYVTIQNNKAFIKVLEDKIKDYDKHMLHINILEDKLREHKNECERQWKNHSYYHRDINLGSVKPGSQQEKMLNDQDKEFNIFYYNTK